MALIVGTRLGGYEIVSAIGSGGRGSASNLAERSPATAKFYENAPVARSAACVPTGTQAIDLALVRSAKSKAEPLPRRSEVL